MIILQDTREQTPLTFNHKGVTEVRRQKLSVGDYGCIFSDGYEVPVYFERKSLPDLFGTLGEGYVRFKKEIIRARESNVKLIIIIERSLLDVQSGFERSYRSGEAILAQLFTLRLRYDIESVFCNNRRESSEYIYRYFYAYGQEYVRNKKGEAQKQVLDSDIQRAEELVVQD